MSDSLQENDLSMEEAAQDEVVVDDLPAKPTEQQLRDAYDNDEIDRFLRLFTTYVQEVTVLDPVSGATRTETPCEDGDNAGDAKEKTASLKTTEEEHFHSSISTRSICEGIAKDWVVPNLPPPRPQPQTFSISRLHVTTQRLYLVTYEPYSYFFLSVFQLATWKEFSMSFVCCSIYWILWWHNLLCAGAILGILMVLVKRKVFLYPSVEELHRHREQVIDANAFGRQVSDRFSVPSSELKDIWHLFRLIETSRKRKSAEVAGKGKIRATQSSTTLENPQGGEIVAEPIIIDDDPKDQHEQDVKRAILLILSEIADLHERVRNIFIWRRPSVSVRYVIVLCIVFLVALLPPQYFLKLMSFTTGVIFWHVAPIIACLSSEERSRLPPAFGDAPTDAEYAMELISRRVASGLEIRPRRLPRKPRAEHVTDPPDAAADPKESNIDWKKWGQRLHTGKSAIGNLKRLNLGQMWPVHEGNPGQHPLFPSSFGIAQPQANVEDHTYPCQHTSSPGLITVSPTSFFFTPLTSQVPTLSFPLTSIKGIKKQGLLKGLQIKWSDESDGHRETKEEKFVWVGSRDDLFARLAGTEGQKWVTF